MNIDFSACATFKGENQKPLITERLVRLGRARPSIQEIAETAIKRGLDGVVLRSFSHPEGTDNRWNAYVKQTEGDTRFRNLGNGILLYQSGNNEDDEVLLIHGQGLETDKGNIQVLFADGQVGGRGSGFIRDFDYLISESKDRGDRVLVVAQKPYLWEERRDLERVDALEVWNGMDFAPNNENSRSIAGNIGKPGVIGSGSKCLWDLGGSYSILSSDPIRQTAYQVKSSIYRGLFDSGYLGNPQGVRGTSNISRAVHKLSGWEVGLTGNKD